MFSYYCENLEIAYEIGYVWSNSSLERRCKELGYKYWIDDLYNYYVHESDDCEVYTKINMEV